MNATFQGTNLNFQITGEREKERERKARDEAVRQKIKRDRKKIFLRVFINFIHKTLRRYSIYHILIFLKFKLIKKTCIYMNILLQNKRNVKEVKREIWPPLYFSLH